MRTRITFHCPLPKLSSQPWSCQASLLERWVITLAHRRLERTAAIGWNGQWNFVRVDRRTSSSTWRSLQDHLGLRNGQPDGGGYVLRFRIVFTHASNSSMRCIRSVGEVNGVPFSGGGRPEEYTHARLGNYRFPVIVWQSLYGLDLSCSDTHPARPSHFGSSGRLAPFGYRALPAPAGRVRTWFGSRAFSTWSG